ncbi:HD-GYP domain-containing protein [Gammaproteobacteria bacterium]|nr:HD-GYP domain-containing protein [Gammaproteobacteria bacterium]
MLKENAEQYKDGLVDTIGSFAKVVEARDPYTFGHQSRVSQLAVAISEEMEMGVSFTEGVRLGALIHDIGKIHIPAEILSKPTKLTDLEYSLIKGHARVGYEILKDIRFPSPVAEIAYQHHERMDGSGYPNGLKGNAICLEARIVAVADVVEAISSFRPYRPALGNDVALKEITSNSGTLFDATVVKACLKVFNENAFTFLD